MLSRAGKLEDAVGPTETALQLFSSKGNVPSARRASTTLQALRDSIDAAIQS